jgi:hypothetical protein
MPHAALALVLPFENMPWSPGHAGLTWMLLPVRLSHSRNWLTDSTAAWPLLLLSKQPGEGRAAAAAAAVSGAVVFAWKRFVSSSSTFLK